MAGDYCAAELGAFGLAGTEAPPAFFMGGACPPSPGRRLVFVFAYSGLKAIAAPIFAAYPRGRAGESSLLFFLFFPLFGVFHVEQLLFLSELAIINQCLSAIYDGFG